MKFNKRAVILRILWCLCFFGALISYIVKNSIEWEDVDKNLTNKDYRPLGLTILSIVLIIICIWISVLIIRDIKKNN